MNSKQPWLRAGLCLLAVPLFKLDANPVGGQVVAGNVTLPGSSPNLQIGVHSSRAIIDWKGFSIGAGETTRFNFDAANGAVLNRVPELNTGNLSVIAGRLESNGRVLLLNPNGVLVMPGAVVDTRGFIASTLPLAPGSFMDEANFRYEFRGDSGATIINQGKILAKAKEGLPGGDVVLIAQTVRNEGVIEAPDGLVGLAAGRQVVLHDLGSERLVVEAGASDASVANTVTGAIDAVTAELKAAGGNIGALAINNAGVVRATTLVHEGGRIFLRAGSGTAVNSGTLDASGTHGGQVQVTGAQVAVTSGAVIDASGAQGGGTIEVGGGYQGAQAGAPNALNTTVSAGATLTADAAQQGDGGQVVVWSDQQTYFGGHISARGGADGGDGGQVETSGKIGLVGLGSVDASAAAGEGGIWLLDPRNVFIRDVPNTEGGVFVPPITSLPPDVPVFTPTTPAAPGDPSIVSRDQIQAALNSGTSVTITTTLVGVNDQAGNLTVDAGANITKSSGGDAELKLLADGDLIVNAPILSTAGKLDLTLTADADNLNGGSITLNAGLTSNGGAVLLSAADNVTVNTAGTIASAGGRIELRADTDGNDSGLLAAGSSISSTALGPLADGDVVLSAAAVEITGAVDAGSVSVTADTIAFNSPGTTATPTVTTTTTAGQDYNGNLTLGAATVLAAGGSGSISGSISVTGTILGAQNLELNTAGVVTLGGDVGNLATPLLALQTDLGGTVNLGGDVTAGTVNFSDDVVLTGDVTVTSGAGNTRFGGRIDRDAVAAHALTLNAGAGDATIVGAIGSGATGPLGAVTANSTGLVDFQGSVNAASLESDLGGAVGGTTRFGGATVTTSGNQTYRDTVSLTGGAKEFSAAIVAFDGNLEGGGNSLKISGAARFGDGVTDTALNVSALEVTGVTTLNVAAIDTGAGQQIYGGELILLGEVIGGEKTLSGGLVSLNGGTGNGQALVINGPATFAGALAGLSTLMVNGIATVNAATVGSSGVQNYNSGVAVGTGSSRLTVTGAGVADLIAIVGDITGGGGNRALTLDGNAILGDSGARTISGLTTLEVTGTTLLNAGTVTTSGNQTYGGNVVVAQNAVLSSTAGGELNVQGTVNGAIADGQRLELNSSGRKTLARAVGSGTRLGELVTTDSGVVNLGGDVTAGTVNFSDDVVLTGDVTVTSGDGNTRFGGRIDRDAVAAHALTLNAGAGDATIVGAIGSGATGPLGAVTANSTGLVDFQGSVNAASLESDLGGAVGGTTRFGGATVTTSGNQTYRDTVSLTGGAKEFSAAIVAFDGNLEGGGNSLKISGAARFGDGVTDTALNVSALEVTGVTTLNVAAIDTGAGQQIYGGELILLGEVIGGEKTLSGGLVSLNGGTGNGQALVINGPATFAGALAGLSTLMVNGIATVNAATVGSSGVQNYNSGVAVGTGSSRLTVTGAGVADLIAIVGDITGGGGNRALTLDGNAILGDSGARTISGLTTLEVTGTTLLNAGTVTTSGNQTYRDTVSLTGGAKEFSAAIVAFDGNLEGGGNSLKISGAARFGDGVTDTALNVSALEVTGVTTLNVAAIDTGAGQQIYGGELILLGEVIGGEKTLSGGLVSLNGGTGNGQALVINGPATFAGALAGLSTLMVNGIATVNAATVGSSGVQNYNSGVAVGTGSSRLTVTGAGVADLIAIVGDITGGGGNRALTLDGNAILGDSGARTISGLTTLEVTGTTLLNAGTVTTSGNQTYGGNVVVAQNAVLSSTAGGELNVQGTVNGAIADGQRLELNSSGRKTLARAVGSGTRLGELVTTDSGVVNLGGDVTAGTVNFSDDVVLTGDVTVTSGAGNTRFGGRIDRDAVAAHALTLNAGAGDATIVGAIGSGATGPLGAVTANSTGLVDFQGSVNAASLITDSDQLIVRGPITVDSLRVTSVGAVELSGNVRTLTAKVTGAGNDFRYTDENDFNLGTVDGVKGVTTTGLGRAILASTAGRLTADPDALIKADGTALQAKSGLGSREQSLTTETRQFEGQTETGGIFLRNTGDLEITEVDLANGFKGVRAIDSEASGDILIEVGDKRLTLVQPVLAASGGATFNHGGGLIDATATDEFGVTAVKLTLRGGGAVGTLDQPVKTAVSEVILDKTGGDTRLTERDAVKLAGSTGGNLDLVAAGAITQSAPLNVNNLTLQTQQSTDVAIDLKIDLNDSANHFGTVTLGAPADIIINDADGYTIEGIRTSGNLTLNSGGKVELARLNSGTAPATIEAHRLDATVKGQLLLGDDASTDEAVPESSQPLNRLDELGNLTVTGDFYLYDSDASLYDNSTEKLFYLDPARLNYKGLEIAGIIEQRATGAETTIRTKGDLVIGKSGIVKTGVNGNLTLSAEPWQPELGQFYDGDFHNVGSVELQRDTNFEGVGQLVVYSSDDDFNTFQYYPDNDPSGVGPQVNTLNSRYNGVGRDPGDYRFGEIRGPGGTTLLGTPFYNTKIENGDNRFSPQNSVLTFYLRSSQDPFVTEAAKYSVYTMKLNNLASIDVETDAAESRRRMRFPRIETSNYDIQALRSKMEADAR